MLTAILILFLHFLYPQGFYTIRQHIGDTVKRYFDRFKATKVNEKPSKANHTKYEYLEISEWDDGNNTNPDKIVKDICLAMAFLECANPVRYNTLWYSLIQNSLTSAYNYQHFLA